MTNSIYTRRQSGATPLPISGNYIAHKRLTKRQRAEGCAAMMDGRAVPKDLNQRQLADLWKVSLAYARRMRRPSESEIDVDAVFAALAKEKAAPQLQQAAE